MNNYKLLPALVSILKTLNLTESANQLNVTQSAMSKTLGQLRIAFNDKIIVREANQFILTPKGEKLRQNLPMLIQQIDNLYAPESMVMNECSRKFIFSSSDYVAQALLPLIFNSMEAEAPNVSVEFLLWQKDSLTSFTDHNIDLVTTIADAVPENLYGKRMAEDKLVVVCRKEHPAFQNNMDLNDYINSRHILISGGGDKNSPVDNALADKGLSRKIVVSAPFFQAAIELLLETDSLLTIPLHIAADFSQRCDLSIKALPLDIAPHHYYLLWHAKHNDDPEHIWFREVCFPIIKNHLSNTISLGMKLAHAYK
ncbi:LysR family transcriptional regulator [Marinomonas sp. 2405UD68-3]|uniref:LysR family transcriptional regulator n=1 Tax=Marinomonas sp. 2405UD68-3 TaxID=3391835 RepID=UPI0039C9EEB4